MKMFATIDIKKFEDKTFLNETLANISKFRREKYDAINNHIGKFQVLANTYLLDKCLNELGLNEKDMEYTIEKNGKLKFTNVPNIHFNLSHSKNMSLAVVSDKPVGCDIQFIDKVDEKLYDLVLSDTEKEYVKDSRVFVGDDILSSHVGADTIRPHCRGEQIRRGELASPSVGASPFVGASTASPSEKFYRLWAMKEAIIKKDGTGLRDRLTDVHDDNVYIEKRFLKSNEVVEEYILAII